MVLLVIALFLAGLLIGIQVDEFFQRDDLKNEYDRGYDEGWLACEKEHVNNSWNGKPLGVDDDVVPPPTLAFESAEDLLKEFEKFLNDDENDCQY